MQIKITMRCHLTPVRVIMIKKTKDKCWRGCAEKGILAYCWGNVSQFSHYEKWNYHITHQPQLLGTYPKDMKSVYARDTYTFMFIAALFTKVKKWKQPKCPSTDKLIRKGVTYAQWNIYSVLKKDASLSFKTTWMELEITMLTEISQE